MAFFVKCLYIEQDNQILINDKVVQKDMEGNWVKDPVEQFSMKEAKVFNVFREMIENHRKLKIISAEICLTS